MLICGSLLHRNRDVCVPGDIDLAADLDLIEHSRIDYTPAVIPSVRTNAALPRVTSAAAGEPAEGAAGWLRPAAEGVAERTRQP